ncbi:saccharopine dehydrogenase [Kitasatospora sp. NPDC008115]|uniref:saccharopine dehydrogenase n=1 Tax=Kitasatospora sp. NPDC008115 TaxID=3364022 RepID=UPI0036E6EADC
MTSSKGIWLRGEANGHEQRTPLVPADAAWLVEQGLSVTVEESPQRVFPVEEYADAGCQVVAAETWPGAPPETVVLGLKEPAATAVALAHHHVFFGHAYKGQQGGPALLRRFAEGGGTLLDLEYLTDAQGRRVAAFGFWAGYLGAALAVLHRRGELAVPLEASTRPGLDALLGASQGGATALVIGALGRSGRGACEALAVAGVTTTRWDVDETRTLDREALLDHDLLVNTVFATEPGTPFLTAADLERTDRRLSVVSDVTCDVTSDCHRLPVYDRVTDWREPVRRLQSGPAPLDLIAIDNLPSLLPRESSSAFSADLLPHLAALPVGAPVWDRALRHFHHARREFEK